MGPRGTVSVFSVSTFRLISRDEGGGQVSIVVAQSSDASFRNKCDRMEDPEARYLAIAPSDSCVHLTPS
jgi:hypothetical protein